MHTKGVTRPEGDHIPYAVAGAIVHCSYGTQLGRLKLSLCHGVYTKDKALMNVNDYEPFQNVMPFGYCTSSLNPAVANGRIDILGVRKAPCVPVLTKEWLNGKEDKIVDGYAALTKESTNMCLYCGMIKILDDGQNLAPVFSEGVDVGECKVPGKEEEKGSDSNVFLEFLYGAGDAALTDTTLGIIVNEPQTDHPIARKTGEIVGHTATTVVGAVETILAGVGLGGSVAISATGVAAPVGVPAAVAAAAGVAYGSSVTVQGAKNIGSSASDLYSMIKGGGGASKPKYSYKNGEFRNADYHGKVGNSVKSKSPQDGQFALDNSLEIKGNTDRKVGIDSNGDFVVLDKTSDGIYHGHVRPWKSNDPKLSPLSPSMRTALTEAGYVRVVGGKGKLTQKAIDLINDFKSQ